MVRQLVQDVLPQAGRLVIPGRRQQGRKVSRKSMDQFLPSAGTAGPGGFALAAGSALSASRTALISSSGRGIVHSLTWPDAPQSDPERCPSKPP